MSDKNKADTQADRQGHAMTKWPHHPNLRKKPHAPSKGRGPVQRAIRRVFMASGAGVLNSTEIYDWAHGRRRSLYEAALILLDNCRTLRFYPHFIPQRDREIFADFPRSLFFFLFEIGSSF